MYQLYRESPVPENIRVYNFIGEQFILTDPKRWHDTDFVEKVSVRVAKVKLNRVGSSATNLKLQTTEGNAEDFHSIEATKTILFFFNLGCEACHAVTEKRYEIFQQYRLKVI